MFLAVQSFFRPTTANILTRISTAADGSQATYPHAGGMATHGGELSPDGRYVLFSSAAENLIPDDVGGNDVFIKDLATGMIRLVSANAAGVQANANSEMARFSSDGHYVVFYSDATNLIPGLTTSNGNIFRKDLITEEVILISSNIDKVPGNNFSDKSEISPDGRYVVFDSAASNLTTGDANGKWDIFLKDLVNGEVTLLSSKKDGTQANDSNFNPHFSPDGRYVLFESYSGNLAGGTAGTIKLLLKDLATDEVKAITKPSDGTPINGFDAQFSRDGRFIVFSSADSDLVAGDTNGQSDIFIKDLLTGGISRVSIDANENQANGESLAAQLSPDGRYVTFISAATNLVGNDDNGNDYDLFMKDLVTEAVTRIATVDREAGVPYTPEAAQFSPDGRYLVFLSGASTLVPGDTNRNDDLFRVDLLYHANAAAIAEGRYIETTLGVGAASSATVLWGDGSSSTVTPVGGSAAFSHAYGSSGTKAATVVLIEGVLTWSVAHTLDLTSGSMVRNIALADTLEGSAGRDSLNGDGTADVLLGGGGNDRLTGYAGNDRLSGGTGQDTLTGGTGRDTFVFDDRETSASKTRADYITDFSRRQGDKIDLSAIDANTTRRGDQKFTFIGDAKTFSKAGEVRFEKTASYTYVYLNTDNDASAEAVIKLKGSFDVSKSWFVL
ncbi:M10 family metallopeptidase C-terminal domain-containing protein [Microvirga flavescens]|uniref:M10 family metallopeptidase C-terminal domain-containing protein n=1 Tax=Microvirga flavescens TaxID=2249811 RepID=UPI0013003C5D|nr:PD40 domain-containing protein [Microvirga flavescens]